MGSLCMMPYETYALIRSSPDCNLDFSGKASKCSVALLYPASTNKEVTGLVPNFAFVPLKADAQEAKTLH